MSVMQIIDELPKLTPADLLAVRRKLIEISEENEGVSLCDAAALEGAQLLDQMEADADRGLHAERVAGRLVLAGPQIVRQPEVEAILYGFPHRH